MEARAALNGTDVNGRDYWQAGGGWIEAELERLSAELVEPAKVTTLEKLDDTGRSFKLATQWVPSRLASEADSTR